MKKQEMTQNRRREFEYALLELMAQMPYSKITVNHLVQRIGVTRKTFYLHFENKDACLDALIDRIIREQVACMADQAPDSSALYRINCAYWKENPELLYAIVKNDLFLPFLNRLVYYMQMKEPEAVQLLTQPVATPMRKEDLLLFFLSGYLAVLLSWAERGFDTPVETIAGELERLIHIPLFPKTYT